MFKDFEQDFKSTLKREVELFNPNVCDSAYKDAAHNPHKEHYMPRLSFKRFITRRVMVASISFCLSFILLFSALVATAPQLNEWAKTNKASSIYNNVGIRQAQSYDEINSYLAYQFPLLENKKTALQAFTGFFKDIHDKITNLFSPKADYTPLNNAIDLENKKSEDNDSNEQNHSETNVQVEGIDEADIIKTDGNYIFALANFENDSSLFIMRANPFESTSRYDADFIIQEMYVVNQDGKRFAILIGGADYSNLYYKNFSYTSSISDGLKTVVLDVTNPLLPKLAFELEFDGSSYYNSRVKDGVLYLLGRSSVFLNHESSEMLPPSVSTRTSTAQQQNRQFAASDIYYMPLSSTMQVLTIASFKLSEPESSLSFTAYLGSVNCFYMSHNNIYVCSDVYFSAPYHSEKADISSGFSVQILRFEVAESVSFAALGVVSGQLLNQFSMDEYDGALRIATTTWSDERNVVYILNAQSKDEMTLLGKLTGLGKAGESIYGVRFAGDVGYVVTFLTTDPLYKLDLSDKANPKAVGELEIPGYSSYLHQINQSLLFGIGMEDNRVKLALYSTAEHLTELNKIIIEQAYFSEAVSNHKALLFYKNADKNYIGFSASIIKSETVQNGSFISSEIIYLQMYYLFEIIDNELILVQAFSYPQNEYPCRALIIGNSLFIFSNQSITKHPIDNLNSTEKLLLKR